MSLDLVKSQRHLLFLIPVNVRWILLQYYIPNGADRLTRAPSAQHDRHGFPCCPLRGWRRARLRSVFPARRLYSKWNKASRAVPVGIVRLRRWRRDDWIGSAITFAPESRPSDCIRSISHFSFPVFPFSHNLNIVIIFMPVFHEYPFYT